jgi:hypothetical protein
MIIGKRLHSLQPKHYEFRVTELILNVSNLTLK